MWIGHEDVGFIIEEAWNRHQSYLSRLKTTKLALKEWNKKIFVDVHKRIKNIKSAIHDLQCQDQTHDILRVEHALKRDLDELLKREEYI